MRKRKMKRIAITVLTISIAIAALFVFVNFRQWLSEDWINRFTIKKIWPVLRREINKDGFSLYLPEGFHVFSQDDTIAILLQYPIEREKIWWCGNPSGIPILKNPLKHRTNGLVVMQSESMNAIDSVNSRVERDVRIGELCNMGNVDTLVISGLNFYGRHGYIDEKSKEENRGRANFGTYMNSVKGVLIDYWGITSEDIMNRFKLSIEDKEDAHPK